METVVVEQGKARLPTVLGLVHGIYFRTALTHLAIMLDYIPLHKINARTIKFRKRKSINYYVFIAICTVLSLFYVLMMTGSLLNEFGVILCVQLNEHTHTHTSSEPNTLKPKRLHHYLYRCEYIFVMSNVCCCHEILLFAFYLFQVISDT